MLFRSLLLALASRATTGPPHPADAAVVTQWVPREEFLSSLASHASPHQAGEGVWQLAEPWIGAVANLVDDPAVLLAELPDWAALLDRHSLVQLEPGPATRARWNNVPQAPADARECLMRLVAVSGLLSYGTAAAPFEVHHAQCRARGDEDCVFVVENLEPSPDLVHAAMLREASLMA